MSTSDTDLNHDPVRVGDERLGVIHSGSRYVLGFGRDYFGIWEQGSPDVGPSQRFPASGDGREAAWERYLQLEPSAEPARTAEIPKMDEFEEARKGWTRGRIIGASVAAAMLILVVVLIQVNKEPGVQGGGGAAVGNAAHIDITGSTSVSEDLDKVSFQAVGWDTLYPKIEASWKGPRSVVHLTLNVPNTGTNTTNENPFRVLDITLQQTNAEDKFVSLKAECTIDLKTLEEKAISGSFDCKDLASQRASDFIIQAKGTFSAQS
jgi:hypothetical protein